MHQREKQPGETERKHSVFNDEARRRQSIHELTSNDTAE